MTCEHPEYAIAMGPHANEWCRLCGVADPKGRDATVEEPMFLCDYQHAGERCRGEATRIGLLYVDGREIKVGVCEHHSYRWGALWGSWPIPELEMDDAEDECEGDECPNCGGTISVNGDRYSSEGPRALICEGCELVYA